MKENLIIPTIVLFNFDSAIDNKVALIEATDTFWTVKFSYSKFIDAFREELYDNHHSMWELETDQFELLTYSIEDEFKHEWTEANLQDWLICRGFDETVSKQKAVGLNSMPHGMLATRSGNDVYLIIK